MSSQNIWNFWASRYNRLWVQGVSLKPTRAGVLSLLEARYPEKRLGSYIDIGCGVGELINEIESTFTTANSHGLDYASGMIALAAENGLKTQWYCEDIHTFEPTSQMNLVVCTHSFPYYQDQKYVLHKIRKMLVDDGRLLMAFASKNSIYDALCLGVVKLTTGKAHYPSVTEFMALASDDFRPISTTRIKEKWYMPSIYLFEMEPKHDKRTAGKA
jgi:2-polyprenyl-3-methyl-5-hydroxy-6-metoxy-1,4-benzoquinol methylase